MEYHETQPKYLNIGLSQATSSRQCPSQLCVKWYKTQFR
jgi:hypothetical protein